MRLPKILFSFGTRPEVIKMAPLIEVFKKSKQFDIRVCNTGQHEDLINSLLEYFEITPDYDLKIMRDSKSLNQTTSLIMEKSEKVLNDFNPDSDEYEEQEVSVTKSDVKFKIKNSKGKLKIILESANVDFE